MSLSPSDILDRMEKLKKWQEEQERLMQQHHKRLHENNCSDENFMKIAVAESRPILSNATVGAATVGASDFENTTFKSKQPFLRRGSGLSRFKMAPGEQFKALTKVKSVKKNNKSTEMDTIVNTPAQRIKSKAKWSNVSVSQDPNTSLLIFEELEKKLKETNTSTNNSGSSTFPPSSTPTRKQLFKIDALEGFNWHISSPKQKNKFTEQVQQTYTADELYDDIKEKNEKMIQENKKQMEEIQEYEKRLHDELLSSLEEAIKFKEFLNQDKAVGSCTPISTRSNDPNISCEVKDFDDVEKWNSNCSISTSSTISSSEVFNEVVTYDAATMTDSIVPEPITSTEIEQLQQRLKQELKGAQDQRNETKQLRKQFEDQGRELEKVKKSMLKQEDDYKDSIVRANAILDEEKKKLLKEKMVFDRYVKDLRNKPNKKEREEISFLKEELSAVRETFKLKEVKNSTLQARLRNQMKCLEKENSELKLEVEKLTKENGRLIATQRLSKKPSDTKLLHEINKNITKLAQDQLNKINEKHQSDTNISHRDKENKKSSSRNCSTSPDTEKYFNCTATKQVKENKNTSNTSNQERKFEDISCVMNFENVQASKSNETSRMSNRTEETKSDGSRIITYSNGNIKNVSPDGNIVEFKYSNGDTKTTNLLDGTICYYYFESKVCHTTQADGVEVLEYPDGQIETRLPSGTSEIKYPNGITVLINEQGEKTLLLPNGQKEIHTKDHKRREYPDGTVKLLYPDGRQETRYSNGRVRIKDKEGTLLFDSLT